VVELLAPLGVHLALFLPFVILSAISPDAVRESKVLVQGLAASLVLAGLAFQARSDPGRPGTLRWPRFLAAAALGASGLAALSGVRGLFSWTDPLVLVPVGAAAALFATGASRRGPEIQRPAFAVLAFAGAFTGLLAFLQRTTGIFRLSAESGEARYQAVALLGNPGDVGAALVIPAIILAAGLMDGARSPKERSLHLGGLALVLLGLAAAEALTPLAAVATALVALAAFDLRKRGAVLAGLAAAALVVLLAVGATARFKRIAGQLGRSTMSRAISERDIGYLSSLEMIRARPLLGEGPGNFSNAFVPARLRAEERTGRRLVHSSPSAHFENAHNEWLTFAAECGLPAALLATAAAGALLVHLSRRRTDVLFSLLVSIGVLGLASFPSRLAVVAGPAAFIAGLAFRAVARESEEPPRPGGRPWATPVLAVAAILLALLSATRGVSVLRQAEGEAALRAAAEAPLPARPYLLEMSRTALDGSAALRSRFAPTWLALGSNYRLDRNLDAAESAFRRSLALEERAETDLNLGRVAFEKGNRDEAMALFRRAVWILPRLRLSLPAELDVSELEDELKEVESGLARGGSAPPLRSPRP
jgi:O-antigen ligase